MDTALLAALCAALAAAPFAVAYLKPRHARRRHARREAVLRAEAEDAWPALRAQIADTLGADALAR